MKSLPGLVLVVTASTRLQTLVVSTVAMKAVVGKGDDNRAFVMGGGTAPPASKDMALGRRMAFWS
jgi:hypothetical protein